MANYVAPVSGTWAAKGSSPFMAARSGGHRYHAGNDLQAKNGSPTVAAIGGTVQYAGHNQGYQWNAVVLGDDGNAYRYATHGPLTVKTGQRIEAGQQVGTIARGHLHFEVIPPTSPAYQKMVANPGEFVSTKYLPGGKASTIDPAEFFGVQRGTQVSAGQPVAAPQDAQSAIASLVDPGGGTQVQSPPSPLMGFAPDSPELASAAPLPAPPPSRPPIQSPPSWDTAGAFPDVQGAAGQETMLGGPMPPMPPSREQGMADQLDAALFGEGPHRGDFARGRPADMFQVNATSGAPDAASVPNPGISPLAPAVGGPNDRRPQPPMPSMRPGGAPDAGLVPSPPARGTPYAPTFPDLYGQQPQYLDGLSAEMGGPPSRSGDMSAAMGGPPSRMGDMSAAMGGPPAPPLGRMPMASRETWDSMGLGSRGNAETQMSIDHSGQPFPASPPNPYDDISRRFDDMPPQIKAQERWDREQMLAQPPAPPPPQYEVGNLNYEPGSNFNNANLNPNPSRIDGMSAKMGGPPAPYMPDFNFAGTPSAQGPTGGAAMTGEGAPSAPNWQSPPGVSGMTYAPPMPPAQPAMSQAMQDQFSVAFSPGGVMGQIYDMNAPSPAAPAPSAPSPPVGAAPAYADDTWIGGGSGTNPRTSLADRLGINSIGKGITPSGYSGVPGSYGPFPGERPVGIIPGVTAGASLPLPDEPINIQSEAGKARSTVAPPALPTPPKPSRNTRTTAEDKNPLGPLAKALGLPVRALTSLLGGGLLGGGTSSFNPIMGSGGSAPYGNNGGTTTYQKGTSNALGGSNALSWTGSKGQPVTVVQDPWTGTYMSQI